MKIESLGNCRDKSLQRMAVIPFIALQTLLMAFFQTRFSCFSNNLLIALRNLYFFSRLRFYSFFFLKCKV